MCWVVESRGRRLPKSVRIIYRTSSSSLTVRALCSAAPCRRPHALTFSHVPRRRPRAHIFTALSSRCLFVSVDRSASACNLRTSAVAICYFSCPVSARSCHSTFIDTQLSDFRLAACHSSSTVTDACQHGLFFTTL